MPVEFLYGMVASLLRLPTLIHLTSAKTVQTTILDAIPELTIQHSIWEFGTHPETHLTLHMTMLQSSKCCPTQQDVSTGKKMMKYGAQRVARYVHCRKIALCVEEQPPTAITFNFFKDYTSEYIS